jgi:hypothetical protein
MRKKRSRYHVILEVEDATPGDAPDAVCLRRFLKRIGREYGMKCTEAWESKGGDLTIISLANRIADQSDILSRIAEKKLAN